MPIEGEVEGEGSGAPRQPEKPRKKGTAPIQKRGEDADAKTLLGILEENDVQLGFIGTIGGTEAPGKPC